MYKWIQLIFKSKVSVSKHVLVLPCHNCASAFSPCVLFSSSFSVSCWFCVRSGPFPSLVILRPVRHECDGVLHGENLCGDAYDDPILCSAGKGLGRPLEVGLLEKQDKVPLDQQDQQDKVQEVRKALALGVQSVLVGGNILVLVQLGNLGKEVVGR